VKTLTLKAFRDMWAHKGQYIALIVLVSLGIASFVTYQNGYYDLKASLERSYRDLNFAELTVQVDRAPSSAARQVEKLPGVVAARVRTITDVGLERDDGQQASARLVSTDDPNSDVNAIVMLDGRFPDLADRREVVLHPKFANETGVGVGDRLTLRIGGDRVVVRVVGIGIDPGFLYPLRTPGEIPSPGEFAVLYMTENEMARLFGRQGSGNDVAIRVKPGTDLDRLSEQVEDELRPYDVRQTTPKDEQLGYSELQGELDQNRIMARTLPTLVLAISSMSLFIALSRLVQAQRGEIGLAKALGYTDGQILRHYLMYALIIAAGGSVLGVALGLWGARGTAALYVTFLGLPFLESGFYPGVALFAVALATLSTVLAAIVPALASARLAPAIAMHSDPNQSLAGGRVPLLERVLSPVLPRALTFRVPLRNVFRARRRTLYTILGIAFAMVLSVVTVSMFDSMDYLFATTFEKVERWDVLAVFESPVSGGRLAEIRRIDGVERVQPALSVPVTLRFRGREEDTVLTAMQPDADFHGFTPVGGAVPEDALAAGDIVLARSTADQLGIAPGTAIEVDSPISDDPVRLRVGSLSEEALGQPVFASLETAAELTGRSPSTYNTLYLDTVSGSGDRIQDELYDMPGAASVQVKAGLIDRLKSLLELFNIFGTVLLVFGSALAFVVVFTTFTANVTERTREIATMRTIGEDNAHLTAMITMENLIIGITALPIGIWLGVQATQALFRSFTTESYTLQAYISPRSIALVCLLMIGVMLLSEIPPVRRIFRLDLAESTKVME